MEPNEDVVNRRGSLSISALLNDAPVEPVPKRKSSSSDDRSGSTSPMLTNSDAATPTVSGLGRSSVSKAKRKRISPQQYNRLMEIFDQTDTPSSEIRENLADELDMTKREVQVWFQNRRAKVNRSKNLVHSRNRQSTSIPPHNLRSRRLSTNEAHAPVAIVSHQHQSYDKNSYPIAPIYNQQVISEPKSFYHHTYQNKPSAIDLLASAAEYVTKDKKEVI